MSSKKDDFSAWETSKEGSSGPGKEYDPAAPEPKGNPAGGESVSHGSPLSPKDYEKLKNEAERGRSPSGKDAQIDPSAC